MSFIRFAFFVFFFYFCASSTNDEKEFILQQPEYLGTCPQIPNPLNRSPSRNEIEGRWYIIRSGLLPVQVNTMTCEVFDISFDLWGFLNILLSVHEDGKFKTRRTKLSPKNTPYGTIIYASELDTSYKGVIRFVDRDFFIFISVACKGKPTHNRSLVVGVRNLKVVPSIIQRINFYIQDLERQGFKTNDVTEIVHSKCTYLPPKFTFV